MGIKAEPQRVLQGMTPPEGWAIRQPALADADLDDLDEWLWSHYQEHEALANRLSLENPFDLFDTDWNQEDDFYEWLQGHLSIHQTIINRLGL